MLVQAVDTCLSSKVVSQNCETISPMAVDAVMGIIDPLNATNVDLRDIKVILRATFSSGSTKTGGGYVSYRHTARRSLAGRVAVRKRNVH